ncbi:hypothetical protein CI238_10283, partial [Colletotrichum incanum]
LDMIVNGGIVRFSPVYFNAKYSLTPIFRSRNRFLLCSAVVLAHRVAARNAAPALLDDGAALLVVVRPETLPCPLRPQVLGAGTQHPVDGGHLPDLPLHQRRLPRRLAALLPVGLGVAVGRPYGHPHRPAGHELARAQVVLGRRRLVLVQLVLVLPDGVVVHLLDAAPPLETPHALALGLERHLHLERRDDGLEEPGVLLDQPALPAPHHHPAVDLGKVGQLRGVELAHHHRVALLAGLGDTPPQEVDAAQVVGHGERVDQDTHHASRRERQDPREAPPQQRVCCPRGVVGREARRREDVQRGHAGLQGQEQRRGRRGDVEEGVLGEIGFGSLVGGRVDDLAVRDRAGRVVYHVGV